MAKDAKFALLVFLFHLTISECKKLHWSYTSSATLNGTQDRGFQQINIYRIKHLKNNHKHRRVMVKSTITIRTVEYSVNIQYSARITYISVHTRKSFPTTFSPDNLEQETMLLCVKDLCWIVCEFSSLTSGVQPALSFRLGSAPWARSLRTSSTSPCTEDQGQKVCGSRYRSTRLKHWPSVNH